jgi:nucleotide-binding universal stress UspA family protein
MNAIVVGTDGSAGAETAVRKVVEMLAGKPVTVHLVCAYPGRSTLERIGMTARQDPVDMRGVAVDVVARDEHRFEDAGFDVQTYVREGEPAQVIIDVATETDADAIVVGAHGSSAMRRFALGGVAGKLAHHAPQSLFIVRES